ncbi:MAG TPA: hypothetical protein VMH36_17485 [Alphaproteobacteria bacterium]|nr:hypothetical protein [Alphaproteobacteria bacterium]
MPEKTPQTRSDMPGDTSPDETGAASLHQAIQQQITELLANADLSEEERQQILVAMQCPCCGAGGLSLSIKLTGARSRPSF